MPYNKERIILFVDILGFSNKIKKSSNNLTEYNLLKTTLKDVQDLFSNNGYGVEILQFSDSLAISVDKTLSGGVCEIVTNASFAMHMFFSNGFLCKGAISYGKLYHNGNILFGPEFMEVMKTEALEDNPTIKFDEKLLNIARQYPSNAQVRFPNKEVEYILQYADKIPNTNNYEIAWYKDYGTLVGGGNFATKTHYQDIKLIIENNIKDFTKVRVLKKYLYLKEQFEKSSYLKTSFPNGIEAKYSKSKRAMLICHTAWDNFNAFLVKLYWK